MSQSRAALGFTRSIALPIIAADLAEMGRPLTAALTVAGLSRDSRAKSTMAQPRRAIASRSRPG